MAFSLFLTASMTAPVEVSSWLSLQASSVLVMDSKPSRVPDPASRPMQAISRSAPPTSFQLVISPLKMEAICSTVRSSTPQLALTTMAMPSRATVVAVRGLGVLQRAGSQANVAAAVADGLDAGTGAGGVVGHLDVLVLCHKLFG